MSVWYIKDNGSVGWSAVSQWQASHAYTAATFVRQIGTPTVNNERTFVCIVAGTSAGSQPSWTLTRGAKTTDNTVTWQECTGIAGPNGDSTNTLAWAQSVVRALGDVIKNVSGGADTYFICTTAGTSKSGAEPTWNKTAGQTTTDGTATWTSIGAISGFSTAFAYPHARLANAVASGWGAAGDTFYISNNHAETQSTAMTLTMLGSGTAQCKYLCVTDTAAPPTAVNTTATITTTSNSPMDIGNNAGVFYMYGVTFNSGTGSNPAALSIGPLGGMFESCKFNQVGVNASDVMFLSKNGMNTFLNCNLSFGAAGQLSNSDTSYTMIGGSVGATGVAPTTFTGGNNTATIIFRDVDFSALTGTLFGLNNGPGVIYAENCKLGVGVVIADNSGQTGPGQYTAHAHNCDSGSKNYRFYTANYCGITQQDTTTVRTNGASDGTTPISWQMASSANTTFGWPLESEEIAQWNDTTGSSKTATVEIAGANSLTNADIWMEIEYPGSASYPLGSNANCRAASILTTPANVTSSAASWGGSPAVTQKLQVTFTPQMKGPIKARIYVAKPSITVYVDPLITVS